LLKSDGLIHQRHGYLLAYPGFGGVGETGHHLVISLNRLLPPAELAKPEALVVQRLGYPLAYPGFGGVGETGHHLVKSPHRLLPPPPRPSSPSVAPLSYKSSATASRISDSVASSGRHSCSSSKPLPYSALAIGSRTTAGGAPVAVNARGSTLWRHGRAI